MTFFRLGLHLVVLQVLLVLLVGKAMAEPKAKYWVGTTTDDIVTQIVAKRISKEFNIEFVFVSYPDFAVKLAAIEAGEVDFISNVTYSEERAEKLYFSAPTNVENTYFFSDRRKNYQDATTVGVPHGTVFSELVSKHAPQVSVVKYKTIVEAKQLIEDGVVDGVIDTMANLKFMALAGFSVRLLNYDMPLTPVSIVTSKPENLEMLKKMEAYLHTAEIQRFMRESSEYYQFEVQRQSLRKQVLLSGLDIDTPFKVKVENYNQLGNYSPDGSVNGIAADVVFEACQLMRIECVLESHADESRQSMYNSLINDEIDILSPIAMIKERQVGAHISNSFFRPEAIVVKRKGYKTNVYRSVSELISERIGVVKDGVYEMVLHRRLPHKPLVTFSSAEEQLSALLAFDVDYIVMTRTTYNRLLRDTKTILPVVEDDMIGTFYEHGIGIGFQKNPKGETLARLFNEALKLLNVESIVHRYDLAPDWQKTLSSQKTFTQKSHQLLVIIVLLLILTSYIWHKQSITDSLTKLHNRAALYRKHKEGLPKDLVLIYFDINKFKVINDSFGHRAGDMVLKTVADNIKSHWRYDSYRIGGDEFILIGWIKHSQIESYLKKMTCFEFDDGVNEPYEVTVSYGCYISNGDHLSLDECIHKADTEMYRFKAA